MSECSWRVAHGPPMVARVARMFFQTIAHRIYSHDQVDEWHCARVASLFARAIRVRGERGALQRGAIVKNGNRFFHMCV